MVMIGATACRCEGGCYIIEEMIVWRQRMDTVVLVAKVLSQRSCRKG